jgi:hypothetical protein
MSNISIAAPEPKNAPKPKKVTNAKKANAKKANAKKADPKEAAAKKAEAWRKWQDGKTAFQVSELAAILGISACSAWAAVNSGEIAKVRVGRRIIIPRPVIERLLSAA